jgi:hypothetical protein
MRTGGAGRPFRHDLHFSSAAGIQIGASHWPRRISISTLCSPAATAVYRGERWESSVISLSRENEVQPVDRPRSHRSGPVPRADRDRSLLSSHSAQGPRQTKKAVAVVRPGFDQAASAAAVRRRYVMNPMPVKLRIIIAQVVHFFRSDWVVRIRRQWQPLYTFCEKQCRLTR